MSLCTSGSLTGGFCWGLPSMRAFFCWNKGLNSLLGAVCLQFVARVTEALELPGLCWRGGQGMSLAPSATALGTERKGPQTYTGPAQPAQLLKGKRERQNHCWHLSNSCEPAPASPVGLGFQFPLCSKPLGTFGCVCLTAVISSLSPGFFSKGLPTFEGLDVHQGSSKV